MSNLAIEWTEKGRIPDALVRAGIRRLLRQRLGEIGAGDAARAAALSEAFVAALRDAPARAADAQGQRAALRAAAVVLRRRAGRAPQVQQRMVARRRERSRRSGGRGTRGDMRARRARRRPGRARARLRLGIAHLVDGRAISGKPHRRRFQFPRAACVHRGRGDAAGPAKRAGDHLRHQRHSRPTGASTAWCRWRCSSTCATGPRRLPASAVG